MNLFLILNSNMWNFFGARNKQMSETVNESIMDITKTYLQQQINRNHNRINIGQEIKAKGAKFNCLGDLIIRQDINTEIKLLNNFDSDATMELKEAIKNGLDAKVNEKLTNDSGPLTLLSRPTSQSVKLENKMKQIVEENMTVEQINEVIRENDIKQKIDLSSSDNIALNCELTQTMYVDIVAKNIVRPVVNALSQSKYIQELETEKKVDMFNGLGMNQMIALIVSCVASVLMMMIGLAMIKAAKGG